MTITTFIDDCGDTVKVRTIGLPLSFVEISQGGDSIIISAESIDELIKALQLMKKEF